jgi:hypothetical protein
MSHHQQIARSKIRETQDEGKFEHEKQNHNERAITESLIAITGIADNPELIA